MFIDIRRLERDHGKFIAEHRRAVDQSVEESAKAGEKLSKNRPGFKHQTKRTKRLTQGRVIRRGGKTIIVRLSNKAKHAAVLEKGSRPHVIRARRKSVLKFKIGGQWISKKSVRHPGTPAYHFLSKGRDVASRKFEQVMRPRMIRAARSF